MSPAAESVSVEGLGLAVANTVLDDEKNEPQPRKVSPKTQRKGNGDPYLQAAMQDKKMREYLLAIEEQFLRSLEAKISEFLISGPMTNREILLISRLAEHFGLLCEEKNGHATSDGMLLQVKDDTSIPDKKLIETFPTSRKKGGEKPKKIMLVKREQQGSGGRGLPSPASSNGGHSSPLTKTVEERQKEYDEAKARIFSSKGSEDGSSGSSGKEGAVKRVSPGPAWRGNNGSKKYYDRDYSRSKYNQGYRGAAGPPLVQGNMYNGAQGGYYNPNVGFVPYPQSPYYQYAPLGNPVGNVGNAPFYPMQQGGEAVYMVPQQYYPQQGAYPQMMPAGAPFNGMPMYPGEAPVSPGNKLNRGKQQVSPQRQMPHE
uniref:SUZ domain-containing protein n=1 Tax=Palpitomonas bilix TaxID=652834 RepID=A0A7S3CZQ5_9EUKA|mmetsp:Transcript_16131/g.40797  ORF Transcript_16131/g.40797 Transcript_16131/m.40797 type:complete len:371 (+) Transcript_16131:176-1288(+)|eukprot:CAMPEP_0113875550 /NCGR_PEP_ID=MMETSP0780_2-20120614/5007_1 /TAXON_ID=652834 /ORGANISM="Palpitomonas bilix" /LENGTH=370 /DNA_ID=CAMNT_0000861557 /DNA_START=96 /DNA_END=1208 /DNA_ORIENTATION=+ /assembly_acc=CAM_ASM_000599